MSQLKANPTHEKEPKMAKTGIYHVPTCFFVDWVGLGLLPLTVSILFLHVFLLDRNLVPGYLSRKHPNAVHRLACFFSQKMHTGGAVFCRHSNRYTIFASCLTYSTSWITSRLAAPARPTFTSIGFTRTFFAKS